MKFPTEWKSKQMFQTTNQLVLTHVFQIIMWAVETPGLGTMPSFHIPSGITRKITICTGKTHYKWPFSIARCVYQRVSIYSHGFFSSKLCQRNALATPHSGLELNSPIFSQIVYRISKLPQHASNIFHNGI